MNFYNNNHTARDQDLIATHTAGLNCLRKFNESAKLYNIFLEYSMLGYDQHTIIIIQ